MVQSRLAALFALLLMVIEAQVVATLLLPIVPILVLVQYPIPQDAQPSLASNLVVFATAIAVV